MKTKEELEELKEVRAASDLILEVITSPQHCILAAAISDLSRELTREDYIYTGLRINGNKINAYLIGDDYFSADFNIPVPEEANLSPF